MEEVSDLRAKLEETECKYTDISSNYTFMEKEIQRLEDELESEKEKSERN